MVARKVIMKSQVADPTTLSDLERRDARGHIFQMDLLINACTV